MSFCFLQDAAQRGELDQSSLLRRLDPRQRKALALFKNSTTITSRDAALLFGISERAARNLLAAWVDNGFLQMLDPAKKTRKYGLSPEFESAAPISR